jgi:hypothetical protein
MDVDSTTIGLISNYFDRDLYFIDGRTRLPYQNASYNNIKNRKSLIIMWTSGVHYEIVGRLKPDSRIARDFEFYDPLVMRIKTFLQHPNKIPEKYPELIPYLPKNYRQNIGINMSKVEEDNYKQSDYQESDNEDDMEINDKEESDNEEIDEVESDEVKSDDEESDDENSNKKEFYSSPIKKGVKKYDYQSEGEKSRYYQSDNSVEYESSD